jgi:hypothetical protein
LVSPREHPNASAAIIAGWVSQVIVFAANKAHVSITPQEGMTASVALISLALFAAGKAAKPVEAEAPPV